MVKVYYPVVLDIVSFYHFIVQLTIHCYFASVHLMAWVSHYMPSFSNLILLALAMGLSFPDFATKVEDTPKYRYTAIALCVVFGIWGCWMDISQRHQGENQTEHIVERVDSTSANVDGIAKSINAALTKLSTLPDIAQMKEELNTVKGQRVVAQKANDTKQDTLLALKEKAIVRQLEDANYQKNLARLPIVLQQLRTWNEPYLEVKADDAARRNDAPYTLHGQELFDKYQELDETLEEASKASLQKLRDIIVSADPLRQMMLQRIPAYQLNEEDKWWDTEFTTAKQHPYERFDGEAAAKYLEDLKRRSDLGTAK